MADPISRTTDEDDFIDHEEHPREKLASPIDALADIDGRWYGRLNPRWMDLVGDYAGMEPFVIDGDSLVQLVLSDGLLAIGRRDGWLNRSFPIHGFL